MNTKSFEKPIEETIYIFWHTFLMKGGEVKFEQIIDRQLSTLISSKLINYAKEINVTACADGIFLIKNLIIKKGGNKFLKKFQFFKINVPYHEGITLSKIKEISDKKNIEHKKGVVLYFHTKGSSLHPNYQLDPIDSWTKMMEYFNLRLWKNCIMFLEKYCSCGCEMWSIGNSRDKKLSDISSSNFDREFWHYSGNFWWARMDYIANFLHHPNFFFKDNFKLDRKLSEYWILSSIGSRTSLLDHYPTHFTGQKYKRGIVHHYLDCYPSKYYENGGQRPSPKLKKIFFSGEVGKIYVLISKIKNAFNLIFFKFFGKRIW